MATVGTLAQLLEDGQVRAVANDLTKIIGASLTADNATPTRDEIKRRFDICLRIFCDLRGDAKWAVSRILDHLPRYLRCELDGAPYSPDADARRGGWAAEQEDPLRKRTTSLLLDHNGRPLV